MHEKNMGDLMYFSVVVDNPKSTQRPLNQAALVDFSEFIIVDVYPCNAFCSLRFFDDIVEVFIKFWVHQKHILWLFWCSVDEVFNQVVQVLGMVPGNKKVNNQYFPHLIILF